MDKKIDETVEKILMAKRLIHIDHSGFPDNPQTKDLKHLYGILNSAFEGVLMSVLPKLESEEDINLFLHNSQTVVVKY